MNDLVDRDREQPTNTVNLNKTCHVPDSGELLIRHDHMFSKTGTGSTHSKSGIAAYQGGVVTIGIGIVIILLCVTNITSNIHLNNAT